MRTSGLGIKGENILSFNEFLLCVKHFVSIFIDYMCPIFPNEEIKSWKMRHLVFTTSKCGHNANSGLFDFKAHVFFSC